MDEPKKAGVDRRSLLAGPATGAAAALIAQQASAASARLPFVLITLAVTLLLMAFA